MCLFDFGVDGTKTSSDFGVDYGVRIIKSMLMVSVVTVMVRTAVMM